MADFAKIADLMNREAVDGFLLKLGLDVHSYNVTDKSASNVALFNTVVSKVYLAELYAGYCVDQSIGCNAASRRLQT